MGDGGEKGPTGTRQDGCSLPDSPFNQPSSRPLPRPVAVYALTSAGASLAWKTAAHLPEAGVFLPDRLIEPGSKACPFSRLSSALEENFTDYGGHVVFAATGIVVRAIAPLLKDKTRDPAVVTVDQAGRFAISLLSGHLGGANDLATAVASILGGQAVITTATDVARKPGLDLLAVEAGLKVENTGALPRMGRAILENEPIDVFDPEEWLKPFLAPWPGCFKFLDAPPDPDQKDLVIWIGHQVRDFPRSRLLLRPPDLVVGMGCNRGTDVAEMETLIRNVFQQQALSPLSIGRLASVEAKKDETGLLDLADRLGVQISFYTTGELGAIKTPNPSTVVQKHMGVRSVCEAAAMLAAQTSQLLVTKQKSTNVTLAVAQTCYRSSDWVPDGKST